LADFFLYNVLNEHKSITERCVSYRNYEMPLTVEPETQNIKSIS